MEYSETRSLDEHKAQLLPYLDGQGSAVAGLRTSSMPSAPWPAHDNPMLKYLLARASEMLEEGLTIQRVLVWLAAHSWLEGALDRTADVVHATTTTARRAQ
jgi:hypothetical protein